MKYQKEKKKLVFLRKTKGKKEKEMKCMKAKSPSNWPFLTSPSPRPPRPKNLFVTKENRYFLQEEEFVDDFFPVLAFARTTEKKKKKMNKQGNKGKKKKK